MSGVLRVLKKFWPDTLMGQMSLAVITALLCAQVMSLWILSGAYESTLQTTNLRHIADSVVNSVRQLEGANAESYGKIVRMDRRIGLSVTLHRHNPLYVKAEKLSSAEGAVNKVKQEYVSKQWIKRLERKLGLAYQGRVMVIAQRAFKEGLHFRIPYPLQQEMSMKGSGFKKNSWPALAQLEVVVEFDSGYWLYMLAKPPAVPPLLARQTIIVLVLSVLFVVLVLVLMLRRIVKPLQQLAVASEQLGRGVSVKPLDITGVRDIRRAFEMFNQMNKRLQRFVQERTTILAAISHDLRTPLTSLQLRADLLSASEDKDKLLDTIDEMRQMTEASLLFARNVSDQEKTQIVDIASVVDSVCSDMLHQGYKVTFTVTQELFCHGRLIALKRAMANIIRNGAVYGKQVEVFVRGTDNVVMIAIQDKGPGIDEVMQERVFEPFFRVESSRSRDTGGVGLGLAISRDIVQSHGGEICFSRAESGDFCVLVTLPVIASA